MLLFYILIYHIMLKNQGYLLLTEGLYTCKQSLKVYINSERLYILVKESQRNYQSNISFLSQPDFSQMGLFVSTPAAECTKS